MYAPGANDSEAPKISSDSKGHVYVTWVDERAGSTDIYFNYSSNYGMTWQANDIRLDTGDAPGANRSLVPQISNDNNGHVYVTWADRRAGGEDIYFNYSSNYGMTWQAKDIRLDTGDAPGVNCSLVPQISNDNNGHVYVVWEDNRNGIYFNYSNDYGVTWLERDIKLNDDRGDVSNGSLQLSSDGKGARICDMEGF